jgi:hypothetical protein
VSNGDSTHSDKNAPTPRTDAAECAASVWPSRAEREAWDHARQLERELAEQHEAKLREVEAIERAYRNASLSAERSTPKELEDMALAVEKIARDSHTGANYRFLLMVAEVVRGAASSSELNTAAPMASPPGDESALPVTPARPADAAVSSKPATVREQLDAAAGQFMEAMGRQEPAVSHEQRSDLSEIEDALWALHNYESNRDDGGRSYSEAEITKMVETIRALAQSSAKGTPE